MSKIVIHILLLALFVAGYSDYLLAEQDKTVYIYSKPSRYQHRQHRGGVDLNIEVPADIKTPLSKRSFKILKESYISSLEAELQKNPKIPDEFWKWLEGQEDIREIFLVAIDPFFDDAERACDVLFSLKNGFPKKIKKYAHLAVAIAIVWDQENAIQSSRFKSIWGFSKDQFPAHRNYLDVFDYFTSSKMERVAVFKADSLRWPLLVHLIDYDITSKETDWALSNYAKHRKDIGPVYRHITYDHQKLETRKPNIGSRSYTLENIKKYNGICGDQAHYTTRIAKTFGIPSMKINGEGRYGGLHAWAGYLVVKRGVPLLEFTGRYRGDMYYTGDVFDPQKRTRLLDRSVEQMFSAVSKKYTQYIETLIASRIYHQIEDEGIRSALTTYALKTNPISPYGWNLLQQDISAGKIQDTGILKVLTKAVKVLKNHPDAVLSFVFSVMDDYPHDNLKKRQGVYTKVFSILKGRPDLQIKLLIQQCEELTAAGENIKALNLLMNCCINNVKESSLILPLVKKSASIIKEANLQKKSDTLYSKTR